MIAGRHETHLKVTGAQPQPNSLRPQPLHIELRPGLDAWQSECVMVADSLVSLRAFAEDRGVEVNRLDASTAASLMMDWYRQAQADDVNFSADGDMLLFEWGTYNWREKSFRYSVTRQFIVEGLPDDDEALWQLAFCFHYPSTADTDALGSGTQWCESLYELDDFGAGIESAKATSFVRREIAIRFELALLPGG